MYGSDLDRVKKLSFQNNNNNNNNSDTDPFDEINMSRKRTLELANSNMSDSPVGVVKRARSSLPLDLNMSRDEKENNASLLQKTNRRRSVVTFDQNVLQNMTADSFASDNDEEEEVGEEEDGEGEGSVDNNMSVDTTVFGNTSTLHHTHDNDDSMYHSAHENSDITYQTAHEHNDSVLHTAAHHDTNDSISLPLNNTGSILQNNSDSTTGGNISGVALLSDTSMSCGSR